MSRMANMLRKNLLGIFLSTFIGHSMETAEKSQPEVKVTFPTEIEKFKEEASKGASNIHIYIPNDPLIQSDQKTLNVEWTSLNFTTIKRLVIQHSLRSNRGYSATAVNTLISLVQKAPNLKEITLSQVLADDLLPHLRAGIHVFLDFSCAYRNNDTIYSKEYLDAIRTNILEHYQSLYPKESGFQINALEIENPFYK